MPKVKTKRVGFVIDMTPLVDITFLLLTFFMFTAKFKSEAESEQKFFINRPEATADTSKIPEANLAIIKIAIDSATTDTSYYYEVINPKDRIEIWQRLISKDKLPQVIYDQEEGENVQTLKKFQLKVDLQLLNELIRATKAVNDDTEFAVDADKRLDFKWIADAMEKMRLNRATKFNYVTKKKGGGL